MYIAKENTKIPISPYRFKQEIYRDEPWKMLIICFMLNQTSYKQVDQVRDEFFEKFPGPLSLLRAADEEVIKIIKPLGFYNRRCKQWKAFSKAWIEGDWENIEDLPGVGKYAADSWKVFQEGRIDIIVEDKELIKYVNWAKEYESSNNLR